MDENFINPSTFTTSARTTNFVSLLFPLLLPNLASLLLRFSPSKYVLVRSYNTIVSFRSNNSLVRLDKCCSRLSFTLYKCNALWYSLSLVTLSISYPVSSVTAEFSFIHLTVLYSEAGYTALLITWVAASAVASSLKPSSLTQVADFEFFFVNNLSNKTNCLYTRLLWFRYKTAIPYPPTVKD